MEPKQVKRLKLDNLPIELSKELIKKKELGASLQTLCEWIDERTKGKYKVSIPTMATWLSRRKDTISTLTYGSPEFRDRVAKDYCDIFTAAKKIAVGLAEEFEYLRESGKSWKAMNETAKTFLLYYEAVQRTVSIVHEVPELREDLSGTIDNIRDRELVKIKRTIMPDVLEKVD